MASGYGTAQPYRLTSRTVLLINQGIWNRVFTILLMIFLRKIMNILSKSTRKRWKIDAWRLDGVPDKMPNRYFVYYRVLFFWIPVYRTETSIEKGFIRVRVSTARTPDDTLLLMERRRISFVDFVNGARPSDWFFARDHKEISTSYYDSIDHFRDAHAEYFI